MTIEIRINGDLYFSDSELLEELMEALPPNMDDVESQILVHGKELSFSADLCLNAESNREFNLWLEELCFAADKGSIDVWMETFEEDTYVRMMSGGEEFEISNPYPW